MASISSSATFFTALVVVMVVVVAVAARYVGRRSGARSAGAAIVLVVAAYLVLPGWLAGSGLLDRYEAPPPALVVLLALTIVTFGLAFSRVGAMLEARLALAALVGFQVFRVPVELLLHRLYVEGVVPVEMTYSGRNFDIVAGVTGGLLGLWLARRPVPSAVLLVWNVGALALLANIVAVAVLATPVSFRQFMTGPPNLLPSTFPYVWLPSFLVQLALFGHLLVFRRWHRERRVGP